jgi:hypothetical protein
MINANRINEIFHNCLFKEEEIINGIPVIEPIEVNGITNNYGLHPKRIKESEDEIINFINELPETFKEGRSFLNLCQTKDGEQWTGLHSVCEQLIMLGMAIGKMKYCFPKEMWFVLPGGVPYIQII